MRQQSRKRQKRKKTKREIKRKMTNDDGTMVKSLHMADYDDKRHMRRKM